MNINERNIIAAYEKGFRDAQERMYLPLDLEFYSTFAYKLAYLTGVEDCERYNLLKIHTHNKLELALSTL